MLFAAAFCSVAGSASADGNRAGDPRFLLFSGTDLWGHGGFSHAGFNWSPNGVDNEGFTLKLVGGGGLYRYRSGALGDAQVFGQQLWGSALPGWRFKRGAFIGTVYAGVDFQSHRLMPDDVSAGLRGSYIGLRTGIDLWYQPSAATMAAADVSVSTVGPGYFGRIAYGWRLLDLFYIGPEVAASANSDDYRQVRAGIHITAFKTRRFEWSAAAGWAADSDSRGGAYGRLGLLTRR
jgi:hypothetical protein